MGEPITRALLTWNMLASFWMLSNVYLSERRWRILKSREPRLDISDSSSSMMSCGVLSFFPRSMARPPGAQNKHRVPLIFTHFPPKGSLGVHWFRYVSWVLLIGGYRSTADSVGKNPEISTHFNSIALTSILPVFFFFCALTVALPVIWTVTETVNCGWQASQ